MGGYLAGRLRAKWVAVHGDKVYFRDTAHGFLAWAVASLATAASLTSAIGSIVNGGLKAGSVLAGGAVVIAAYSAVPGSPATGSAMIGTYSQSGAMNYFVDSLFRKDMKAATVAVGTEVAGVQAAVAAQQGVDTTSAEVMRIFTNGIRTGALPAEDVRYVGQLVAQRIGLTQPDAEKRVNETYALGQAGLRDAETAARDAADQARKASAHATLWLFLLLLIGAFVASLAATFGGRQRDA